MQTYPLQQQVASPLKSIISLPLVSTGPFYDQLVTLQNIYLLTKNPYMVAQNGRLLADVVRTLSSQLESLIDGLDPVIREAVASHSIEVE